MESTRPKRPTAYEVLERERSKLAANNRSLLLMLRYSFMHPLRVWVRKYLFVLPMKLFPSWRQRGRMFDITVKDLAKYEQAFERETIADVEFLKAEQEKEKIEKIKEVGKAVPREEGAQATEDAQRVGKPTHEDNGNK